MKPYVTSFQPQKIQATVWYPMLQGDSTQQQTIAVNLSAKRAKMDWGDLEPVSPKQLYKQ